MLISDVMCLWVSSFRKKGGCDVSKESCLWLVERWWERERQCMWYWTRWERGMREGWEMREREIGQDSSEAKAGWVKEKWNVFFFFCFFLLRKERERECVCVCVWSKVWLVMICSGPLYLIFFSLFALEHEEAYEWRGIWLRVRWCDTIISELIDMV